ncbi:MAG TPA: Rieske (2Fe-2S) protein [Terriglobales bacterium]|jgi:Rieske Fe-S protein|nr:Rieske (2Fe-2S) protein [Terriglobales bacterium]
MNWLRRASSEPLWKDEFSIHTADEKYVTRRQLTKFLVLTSLGMFVGNIWILIRSVFYRSPQYAEMEVALASEIPINGVKLFGYPTEKDRCIMVRTTDNQYVAYSQKCTHLSCAVYYSQENKRLECPCHEGFFSVEDGSVLQGPPPRPLPKIELENRAGVLVATGVREG